MALDFDGVNQRLIVTDDAILDFPNGDWTMSFWARIPDNSGTFFHYFYSQDSGVSANQFSLLLAQSSVASNPNTFRIIARDSADTALILTSSTTPGTSTDWQHYAARRSSGTFELFVDGTSVTSATPTIVDIAPTNDLRIGCRFDDNADRHLDGSMCEIAKWNTALSDEEITALANGGSVPRFHNSLTFYLPMWGSSPSPDLSGNLSTATHQNSPTRVDHAPVGAHVEPPTNVILPVVLDPGTPSTTQLILRSNRRRRL